MRYQLRKVRGYDVYDELRMTTPFFLKQGPNGDVGFRGFAGPKGPMGNLVSGIKIATMGPPLSFSQALKVKPSNKVDFKKAQYRSLLLSSAEKSKRR